MSRGKKTNNNTIRKNSKQTKNKKKSKKNKSKIQKGGFGNELKESDIHKFKDSLKVTSNNPEIEEIEGKASSSPNYPGKFPVPDCSIM